jgi:hypothetical protein
VNEERLPPFNSVSVSRFIVDGIPVHGRMNHALRMTGQLEFETRLFYYEEYGVVAAIADDQRRTNNV